MPGRIRDEDIAEVREKTRIDDVISSYVTLRSAGGGSFKGLCPFHDEKSPSFNVNPTRGFFHCFGCGEGGDVISFVMKMDGLAFAETVERLAEKCGVQLRYEEGGPARPSGGPQRGRLVEAHRITQEMYAAQLASSPDALAARRFLHERGFGQAAAETFGVGFSPRGGEEAYRYLRDRGFTDDEVVAAGIVGKGGRGHYDRFRGRLMWPIRDASGDTIGFGARRIFDDDRIEAKYLNTGETAIYKKSQVLYGIDLARREIAKSSQAVVVEGYTDVMACHLSGVPTAVATCGTAFGEDHARVVRRLLMDHEVMRGEVIFTFDGDAAGQKAALRAFEGDQQFVAQTYVAVEPTGLDPCDLRLQHGEEAVRDLVARRTPLYRFVLGNVVKNYDLDRADGRVAAVQEAARLVTSSRDSAARNSEFAREISQLTGVDPNDVVVMVRRMSRNVHSTAPQRSRQPHQSAPAAPAEAAPAPAPSLPMPDPRDPRISVERGALKLVVQRPDLTATLVAEVHAEDFLHPAHQALWRVVEAKGGPRAATPGWVADLAGATADPTLRALITALAVEPIVSTHEPDRAFAATFVNRLRELTAQRRITDLKARLQRTNPVEHEADYNRMFGELVALEQHRRSLRDLVVGS